MTNKDYYKLWAPKNSVWSAWVRPVLFLDIDQVGDQTFVLPELYHHFQYEEDTIYFIDLPKEDSVLVGIQFMKKGYRPIALYNASPSPIKSFSLVDNIPIQRALKWSSKFLQEAKIKKDALPVFLLDSNRILRHKVESSVFDNSWDLYKQDIPSPDFLIKHKINKIVIYSYEVHRDLRKILYEFQQKGFEIYHTVGVNDCKKCKLKKPPKKDKFH